MAPRWATESVRLFCLTRGTGRKQVELITPFALFRSPRSAFGLVSFGGVGSAIGIELVSYDL
eukprot:8367697-Alexandrium_andersonii.AAC.1